MSETRTQRDVAPESRADLAQLQLPRAARGSGRAHAAAGALEVPRHRRIQPGRVLHEADRRIEAAGRGGDHRAHRGWPHTRRADRAVLHRGARARGTATGDRSRGTWRAGNRGHRGRGLAGPEWGAPQVVAQALRAQHLPFGDTPGDGPRPPLPLHLESVAQPARHPALPARRAHFAGSGQGTRGRGHSAFRASGRIECVGAARERHGQQPRPALSRHGGPGLRDLPRHPQRHLRCGRGHGRRPPRTHRGGTQEAPPGPHRAPAGRRRVRSRTPHHARQRARAEGERHLRGRGAAGLGRPASCARPRGTRRYGPSR